MTLELNDSHTLFYSPQRAARVDYGLVMTAIGDSVYVTAVRPGSDAEARGLAAGDRVVALNDFPAARPLLWQMRYYYEQVSPRTQLSLTVEWPGGTRATIDVQSRVTPKPRFQNPDEGFRDFTIEG